MLDVNLLKTAKIATSNLNKLREFQSIIGDKITIAEGLDLKEVDADPLTVMLHKSKDAGAGLIIEDTVLYADGEPIVDIRFRMSELSSLNKTIPAIWKVTLGYNDGQYIYLFEGVTHGLLKPNLKSDSNSFGFDPYFFVESENKSLAELDGEGRKVEFSARKRAVENMMKGVYTQRFLLSEIEEWKGGYQG